jgi:lipopolysaccharide transport system ATP-binding protein
MSSDDIAIRVSNLSKSYLIYETPRDRLKQFVLPLLQRLAGQSPKQYYREFRSLNDVSFEVRKGETVGVIGRNGSGKSTVLQIICGTLTPTGGTVETRGRIAALLELGSGFNPEFTGRENVYLNAAVLGLSQKEIDERYDEIVTFADIGEFIEHPIKTYSSGMAVRLAFAVAISVDPQILVVDEALAVGDAAFQRKCIRRIQELTESGVTLLFVSHSTDTIKSICARAIYLNSGELRALGLAKDVCIEYERDLFGASRHAPDNSAKATPPKPKSLARFDSELCSSAEKTYGDGRASIEEIAITDSSLELINVIPAGDEFTVSYSVHFRRAVTEPVFGMRITTREGVGVFGSNTTGMPISGGNFAAGDTVRVSFKLTNNLGSGIYYLTCGVHSKSDADGFIYFQRRMDAVLFRSLSIESQVYSAGIAYMTPTISAEKVN